MNRIEQGFLGVAAVCAVVAGGWIFWDTAWDSVVESAKEVHGTLYWDLDVETVDGATAALVLSYEWTGSSAEPVVVTVPGFRHADPLNGIELEPGRHVVRIPGSGSPDVDGATFSGYVTAVRSSGSRPAR